MKKIVVYFSYTNHTKMIANLIAQTLHCDILELKPVVPYSNNYSQVVQSEQNSEASEHLPEIQSFDVDIRKYDEIILGTPVWWYRPAPVIRTFLTNYDFSGKIVKPFATNAGWLGKTFTEIKKMCPGATVESGMNIVFTEDYKENKLVTSQKEIDEWIQNL